MGGEKEKHTLPGRDKFEARAAVYCVVETHGLWSLRPGFQAQLHDLTAA